LKGISLGRYIEYTSNPLSSGSTSPTHNVGNVG
jgi:hypothetical protein